MIINIISRDCKTKLKGKTCHFWGAIAMFLARTPWTKLTFSLLIILAICAFMTSVYAIWHLPLGYADESFYVYLVRSQKAHLGTSFALYFNCFKNLSIAGLRLIGFILQTASSLLLSYSVCLFFQKIFCQKNISIFLIVAGAMLPCIVYPQGISCPSYITLSFFFGCCTFAFMLLALTYKKLSFKYFAYILSGFCCVQLVLCMPPSLLLAVVLFLTILFLRQKEVMYWCIGIICGLVVFFVFIQSPAEFYANTMKYLSISSEVNHHDSNMLLRWSISTALFFMSSVIMQSLGLCSILKLRKTDAFTGTIFLACFLGCLGLLAVRNVMHTRFWTSSCLIDIALLYTCLLTQIYFYMQKKCCSHKATVLLLFCMLMPILLSLGTDVPFHIRGLIYSIFLFLPILILDSYLKERILHIFVFFLVAICCAEFFLQFNAISWATNMRFFDQGSNVCKYGMDVPLTTRNNKTFEVIQRKAPNIKYIVGNIEVWQYIAVLGKKPIGDNFCYAKANLIPAFKLQNITKENVVFIEYKNDEKYYPSNWLEEYQTYFKSVEIKRIDIDENTNLLIFL